MLQTQRTGAEVVLVAPALAPSLAELCAQLHAFAPPPRVLFVDSCGEEKTLLYAIECGVDGYANVAGGDDLGGLIDAVLAIARGETVVPPAMLGPLLRRLIEREREATHAGEQLSALTPREREVLSLLAGGLDPRGVAERLVISPATARTHVQRITRKLGVRSRGEAVELAARSGMAHQLERLVEGSVR